MRFSKAKHQLLTLSHNPTELSRLGAEWLESCRVGKDLGGSNPQQLNMSSGVPWGERRTSIPTCVSSGVASRMRGALE